MRQGRVARAKHNGTTQLQVLLLHDTNQPSCTSLPPQVLAFMSDGCGLTGNVATAGGTPNWAMHVVRDPHAFCLQGTQKVLPLLCQTQPSDVTLDYSVHTQALLSTNEHKSAYPTVLE